MRKAARPLDPFGITIHSLISQQHTPLDGKMRWARKKRGDLIMARASCSFTRLNERRVGKCTMQINM